LGEVGIDSLAEPRLLMPPLETLIKQDLADPAAAHADTLLTQVRDQAIQRPAGKRQV